MSELAPDRQTRRGRAWPTALGAAVVTFVVAVLMPPLAALAGVAAVVALALRSRRPLPRGAAAVATGVVAAVICYLAIWLVGSIVDPGDPASGTESVPAPAGSGPSTP